MVVVILSCGRFRCRFSFFFFFFRNLRATEQTRSMARKMRNTSETTTTTETVSPHRRAVSSNSRRRRRTFLRREFDAHKSGAQKRESVVSRDILQKSTRKGAQVRIRVVLTQTENNGKRAVGDRTQEPGNAQKRGSYHVTCCKNLRIVYIIITFYRKPKTVNATVGDRAQEPVHVGQDVPVYGSSNFDLDLVRSNWNDGVFLTFRATRA